MFKHEGVPAGSAATSTEVTGQSGQSESHTVGEHRPGGPQSQNGTTRTYNGPAVALRYDRARSSMAGLGTGGEAGPGTDVEPARATAAGGPERTRMAGVY